MILYFNHLLFVAFCFSSFHHKGILTQNEDTLEDSDESLQTSNDDGIIISHQNIESKVLVFTIKSIL
jgi:hypothetical protein